MQYLGNLTITTPTDLEIVIKRDFDASRELVWRALTTPDLLKRWMTGPDGWTMTVCDNDPTEGAEFQWMWRADDGGTEMSMRGVYREVVPFERIVRTEQFLFGCDAQAGEQVGTMTLTEEAGKTLLKIVVLFPSKEARDGAIASGMDKGLSAGFDRLDEVLATIA